MLCMLRIVARREETLVNLQSGDFKFRNDWFLGVAGVPIFGPLGDCGIKLLSLPCSNSKRALGLRNAATFSRSAKASWRPFGLW